MGAPDHAASDACITNVWTGETCTIDEAGRFESLSTVYRAEDKYGRMIAPPPDYWDEAVVLKSASACPCGWCTSTSRPDFDTPEQMELYTKHDERKKLWRARRERIWHPIRRLFKSVGKFMNRCLTACSLGRRKTPV
jgi:hypothetical protein